MSLNMQSKTIRPLEEYLQEEADARTKNLTAFNHEFEMAKSLFAAAQEVYAHLPASDRVYWKVQVSLLAATIRYYATAVDLCLRGNTSEAIALMRSSLEQAAYIVKVGSDESLAEKWVEMDKLSKPERLALFGSDSKLMEQPQIVDAAKPIHSLFSVFGVHARMTAVEQTIEFEHPFGWRIRHAEEGTEHVRYFLLAILFAMQDMINLALVPSLLDGSSPHEVTKHLEAFERERSQLGSIRKQFMRWIKNPCRPKTQTKVAGLSTVLVDNRH
jgi:hypothetical protein